MTITEGFDLSVYFSGAFERAAGKALRDAAGTGLNPEIVPRVQVEPALLVADKDSQVPGSVYSSWPFGTREKLPGYAHGE